MYHTVLYGIKFPYHNNYGRTWSLSLLLPLHRLVCLYMSCILWCFTWKVTYNNVNGLGICCLQSHPYISCFPLLDRCTDPLPKQALERMATPPYSLEPLALQVPFCMQNSTYIPPLLTIPSLDSSVVVSPYVSLSHRSWVPMRLFFPSMMTCLSL